MRRLIAILPLVLTAAACGSGGPAGAGSGAGSKQSASTGTKPDVTTVEERVRSVSREIGPIDEDDSQFLERGQPASARERAEIVALVRRYYRYAAAANGKAACAVLYSATATEVIEERDDWGVRGKTCPVLMTKIFRRLHARIEADLRSMKIVRVRTDRLDGYIVMRVPGSTISHEFSLRRVGRLWQIGQVIDRNMR
jgi:hypothetical protein